jgi:hypothetical protein
MGWAGQVFCIQKDPVTVLAAISEGMHAVRFSKQESWILSVTESGGNFTGHIFRLLPDASGCELKIVENDSQGMANSSAHDKALFHWLETEERVWRAPGFEIVKPLG